MSDKKYQVFISSTYLDLIEERKAVEQTIIRSGDFPVGMEAFPAADEEQFEFIKTVISQCDYYLLIIAGMYGSLAPDGKSYTEKEYDYAVSINVPVLVMLREERGELPGSKTEPDSDKRQKLNEFIDRVSTGRIRKGWKTTDGLKLAVRESLDYAKATKPRPGWVRGDQSSSQDTLEKLIAAHEENERLKKALDAAKPKISTPDNIAGLDAPITISGTYKYTPRGEYQSTTTTFSIETTFGEVFELLSPHLMQSKTDERASQLMAECLWKRHDTTGRRGFGFGTNDEVFQTTKIQLMALGLVDVRTGKTVGGGVNLFWSLTESGSREMLNRRVVRALEDPAD